ncbi:MAG: hypothetical protein HN948_05925 [Clostridia bacterium]|jgi:hypothetical protein|nr:hypothetical protein [Clostridia bacterium]MBT7122534.1 hypothetical protein [Clostridia bacterium]
MSTMQEQYDARLKRVMDASKLIEPDQIPIVPVFQAFPINYAGGDIARAMEDFDHAAACYDKFYTDFKPDLGWDPVLMYPTNYLESSGITWFRWPGKHIEDKHAMYQFIEDEYMREDEYPEAIKDLTSFIMNKWMPRSFANFSGLSKLSFKNNMWFGHMGSLAAFSDPEVIQTLEAMVETGKHLMDWFVKLFGYRDRMKEKFGIPQLYADFAFAPFDKIGDSMRGTPAILKDMYDHPDELLELIDIVTDFTIKDTIAAASGQAVPFVWFWLHKGVDEFMSDEHFKKFYWPSLRRYITEVAEAGLTPMVYVEGAYNSRLEYLKEVPAGKVVYSFEYTDMAEAKKVLGGHSCIMGNVPAVPLTYGKPQEITDYVKWLIDTCAPGGGFIMDTGTMVDDAKTENIQAMFDATAKYGKR